MDKLINYLNDNNIITVISDELLSTNISEARVSINLELTLMMLMKLNILSCSIKSLQKHSGS